MEQRYFRLNPDVDVGLDLWRDVNLLCQSLHSDDVEDFWRTQDEWVVSGWRLYPKSSVHVLDFLTNGSQSTPHTVGEKFVVAGSVIQTIQDGLRGIPMSDYATARYPRKSWLTISKTALVSNSNPVDRYPGHQHLEWYSFSIFLLGMQMASPGGARRVNTPGSDSNRLKFFFIGDVHISSYGAVLRQKLSSIHADYVPAGSTSNVHADYVPAGSTSNVPADCVSAGHVHIPADRDRICWSCSHSC
ncbi:hypothetical protein Tco_1304661 [Tanacetum coccineum]